MDQVREVAAVVPVVLGVGADADADQGQALVREDGSEANLPV